MRADSICLKKLVLNFYSQDTNEKNRTACYTHTQSLNTCPMRTQADSRKPVKYKIGVAALLLHLLISPIHSHAEEETTPSSSMEEGSKTEFMLEFDPYYTSAGMFFPLSTDPILTITSDSELEIYSKLVEGSAIPRYMLLEASVYPLPVLGTYLKSESQDFYNRWQVGSGGSNLLESATAGFQEPWAVSAFFGNIANLVRPGETRTGSNMGYTGYLVSAGAKHIKENVMISDNWYELEWKIKGKRNFPNDKMQWSFRVGGKFHDNPGITNVAYAAIHRNNLNADFPFLDWIENSELDLKIHFSQLSGAIVRTEMIVGKKYPIANKDYTPTLNIGFIWSSPEEYSGLLRSNEKNTLTLVFRPSIEF